MAVFPSFNLTKKGEELLNRSIGEGRVLTFTKFKIGDGVPTGDWRDLENLQSSFKEFSVLETAIQADQVLRIRGYFDNKGFATDKQFKEIGIFVTLDGVAGEHLYSYTNAGDTGDIIPAESRGFYSRTLDVNNYIGYATNITFNIEQTRDNYDFNTENELKVATFLKKGDKIRLWGRLVLGDIETLSYIVTDEVTSLTLNNGLYCKLTGDNRAFTVKTDLVNLKGAVVGDVVEVLGFHTKGDGSHHKRIAKAEDDGSGEQGQNGIWWCIVHNGEVNVSWFGAKGDGVTDDAEAIQKAIKCADSIKFAVGEYFVSNFGEFGNYSEKKTIVGEGNNNTIIKIPSFKADYVFQLKCHMSYRDVCFDGMTLSGETVVKHFNTFLLVGSNSVAENCIFKDFNGSVYFHHSGSIVRNCTFENPIDHALYCRNYLQEIEEGTDCIIENNIFKMSQKRDYQYSLSKSDPRHAIKYAGCFNTLKITENIFYGHFGGITITDGFDYPCKANDVLIKNNNADTDLFLDINMDSSINNGIKNILITGNKVSDIKQNNSLYEDSRVKTALFFRKGFISNIIIDSNTFNITKDTDIAITEGNISEIFVYNSSFLNFSYYTSGGSKINVLNCFIKTDNEQTPRGDFINNVVVGDYFIRLGGFATRGTIFKNNIFYNMKVVCNNSGLAKSGIWESNIFENCEKVFNDDTSDISRFLMWNNNMTINTVVDNNGMANSTNRNKIAFSDNYPYNYESGLVDTGVLRYKPTSKQLEIFNGTSFEVITKATTVSLLDTPYYAYKMQQERIYSDYVAYRDELHEYENSQTGDETMLLPVLQEPVIPESVKAFAEKYKLI